MTSTLSNKIVTLKEGKNTINVDDGECPIIHAEDVREFIRQLKKKSKLCNCKDCNVWQSHILLDIDEIDKLAGQRLVGDGE